MRVATGVKVKGEMLIGQLSELTGTSARSLRYYEEKGLLASARTHAGYRVYGAAAPAQVRRIRGLLDAGFDTEAIRVILPCARDERTVELCPTVEATMRAALSRIDADLDELARRRAAVSALLE
ncbi:MerR family transcriptional regulator [Tsukamurella pulmonis]|uniref:MerR family transcriptional regulator n=1 Tax=Tsukamurella pulmonis TaxID=47312 RepID=UPI001EE0F1C5|nr:MerR family transcriptional regulator [Tsukamurella pulmonis]BDD82634.1 MerR family transcriptional regulator [Tsukamurella pulmonis]